MTTDELHTQALAFKGDWSITTAEWHWLAAITKRLGTKRVLEFGPGYSTLAFVAGGATRIDSIEGSDERLRLPPLQGDTKLTINWVHRDLTRCVVRMLAGYDLAFVDAPPGDQRYYSRLNTVLCALDCARTVILHDTARVGERRTLDIVANLGVEVIERRLEDMGMAVLRRVV